VTGANSYYLVLKHTCSRNPFSDRLPLWTVGNWSSLTCFCCVLFCWYYTRDWLEKSSPKWCILCWLGCKTPWINQIQL